MMIALLETSSISDKDLQRDIAREGVGGFRDWPGNRRSRDSFISHIKSSSHDHNRSQIEFDRAKRSRSVHQAVIELRIQLLTTSLHALKFSQ